MRRSGEGSTLQAWVLTGLTRSGPEDEMDVGQLDRQVIVLNRQRRSASRPRSPSKQIDRERKSDEDYC